MNVRALTATVWQHNELTFLGGRMTQAVVSRPSGNAGSKCFLQLLLRCTGTTSNVFSLLRSHVCARFSCVWTLVFVTCALESRHRVTGGDDRALGVALKRAWQLYMRGWGMNLEQSAAQDKWRTVQEDQQSWITILSLMTGRLVFYFKSWFCPGVCITLIVNANENQTSDFTTWDDLWLMHLKKTVFNLGDGKSIGGILLLLHAVVDF